MKKRGVGRPPLGKAKLVLAGFRITREEKAAAERRAADEKFDSFSSWVAELVRKELAKK